jgi:ATP-dependent RNA helicase DDX49/DBP8
LSNSGLDIPTVELVLNFDIPRDPTDYIHRVGRTARAGRGGQALSIVSEHDIQLIQNIEAKTSQYFKCDIAAISFFIITDFTSADKQMEEYKVNENTILEELNEVTTAKRVARMVSKHLEKSLL